MLKYNANGEVPLEFKSCILSVELYQIYLGSLFSSKMHYFLFWFLFKYFLVSELPHSKFSRFWVRYWKYVIKNYKNQVCLKLDDQGKLVHLLSLRLWDGCLRYSHVFFVIWSWCKCKWWCIVYITVDKTMLSVYINIFHAADLFLHPPKTSTSGFLMFSWGIERDQGHEISWKY